jgi:hypothetical protein
MMADIEAQCSLCGKPSGLPEGGAAMIDGAYRAQMRQHQAAMGCASCVFADQDAVTEGRPCCQWRSRIDYEYDAAGRISGCATRREVWR